MHTNFLAQRAQVLQQMAGLQTMEEGSLKAEFRTSASGAQAGPYYKHQVWRDGRNISQRVPADEASALEGSIANRQQFEALAAHFVALTIAHTRQQQTGPAQKKTPSLPRKTRRSRN